MDTAEKAASEQPAKRTGRPMKTARKGRRYQIGVIVTGETKTTITEAAKESGRTISREVEHMIERCLQYDAMFKATARTLQDIDQGDMPSVEAALWRRGFTPHRHVVEGKAWKFWTEPGFPGIERSGFVP